MYTSILTTKKTTLVYKYVYYKEHIAYKSVCFD